MTEVLFPHSDQLRGICEEYHKRIVGVEDAKYDIEKEVEFKDYKVICL